MANALAVCVDSLDHDHIVGSVAGDDTIIIVTKEDEIAESMQDNLKEIFKID
jgi:transcriptional regulator of arginine metabolism